MAEMKFEDAIEKLEKIVAELEEGGLPLEKSLKKFEEGIKLSRFCSKKLKEAERKIELLTKTTDGELETKSFEPEGPKEEAEAAGNGEDSLF
jgi:exodeoxyribonuclease VII small subunit